MWFPLSLLALSMLVARRSSEKILSSQMSSLALAWLQQAVALPFIVLTLFFARFYWPAELSSNFWVFMAVYVVCSALDIYCYFKALSLADISYVAPLLTLVAVGNVAGSYFVLGQVPSFYGILGAGLIVLGAGLTYHQKRKDLKNIKTNSIAAFLILFVVLLRSYYGNIEVFMIRESNPTTFNFYSSLLTVPLVLLATLIIIKTSRSSKFTNYWPTVKSGIREHRKLLIFIGVTNSINMLAAYSAKLVAPSAGYVGAVKSASVLPMVLIGVLFFKEKINKFQGIGLLIIVLGLILLGTN